MSYLRLKLTTIVFVIPMLVACAQDNYTLSTGAPITDSEKYKTDLKACEISAFHEYQQQGCSVCGAFGLIGGLISASSNPVDTNSLIQKCMVTKGYVGTSKGHD